MSEKKLGGDPRFDEDHPQYQQMLNDLIDPEVRKRLEEQDERFQIWFGQARKGDPEALRSPRQRQAYYTARAAELLSQHWTPDFEVLFWVLEHFYCGENRDHAQKKEVIVRLICEKFRNDEYDMTESKAKCIDAIARPMLSRGGGRSKNP